MYRRCINLKRNVNAIQQCNNLDFSASLARQGQACACAAGAARVSSLGKGSPAGGREEEGAQHGGRAKREALRELVAAANVAPAARDSDFVGGPSSTQSDGNDFQDGGDNRQPVQSAGKIASTVGIGIGMFGFNCGDAVFLVDLLGGTPGMQ
ncbi:hypothetical protein chiPu_0001387 [Chiloscyllium punctatum]|uniref:Uncharacterized protein n=1 Tax=Chiloscyllium punctatum TaxID=137246 RepID=A0A401RXX1_CHIPU|nr:hypothetical protein [Chiloscyllium punctatum]